MSQPFARLVSKRAEQMTDQEIVEQAFARFNRWAMLSSGKMVSLDEVAWIGALMCKGLQSAGLDPLAKHETQDENGARVVGIVADDGVSIRDGAG